MRFDRTIIIPPEDKPKPAYSSQPTRAPSLHADVTVPISSALITAVLISVSCAVLLMMFSRMEPLMILRLAAAVFILTTTVAWFFFRDWAASTIERIEEVLNVDLNRDGHVGTPDIQHVVVNGNGQTVAAAAERQQASDLEWFVRMCFLHGTAEKKMVGKQLPNGQRLTQRRYDELKTTLIRARWARSRGALLGGWEFMPGLTADQIVSAALAQNYR